jgi:hypothetical protein
MFKKEIKIAFSHINRKASLGDGHDHFQPVLISGRFSITPTNTRELHQFITADFREKESGSLDLMHIETLGLENH